MNFRKGRELSMSRGGESLTFRPVSCVFCDRASAGLTYYLQEVFVDEIKHMRIVCERCRTPEGPLSIITDQFGTICVRDEEYNIGIVIHDIYGENGEESLQRLLDHVNRRIKGDTE